MQPDLVWVELTKNVVELAAAIRVGHGLTTPDALQAAKCLQVDASNSFLSGDSASRRVDGLNVNVVARLRKHTHSPDLMRRGMQTRHESL